MGVDVAAVQKSMGDINKDVVGNMVAVYTKLFETNADLKPRFKMFSNVSASDAAFKDFATKFAADLTALTNSLGNEGEFGKWIAQSKARHFGSAGRVKSAAEYGVVLKTVATVTKVDAWTQLGDKVVAAM